MFTGDLFFAVVAASAAAIAVLLVHRFDARLPRLGRRIIVNFTDGTAARGILTAQRGPWLVLNGAELLPTDGTGTVRVDGELFIERPRVLFVQVLT